MRGTEVKGLLVMLHLSSSLVGIDAHATNRVEVQVRRRGVIRQLEGKTGRALCRFGLGHGAVLATTAERFLLPWRWAGIGLVYNSRRRALLWIEGRLVPGGEYAVCLSASVVVDSRGVRGGVVVVPPASCRGVL